MEARENRGLQNGRQRRPAVAAAVAAGDRGISESEGAGGFWAVGRGRVFFPFSTF